MLAKYIFLVVFVTRGVFSGSLPLTLNLSSPSYDNLVTEYKEFDNVSYGVYKPKKSVNLVSVVDGQETLWKGNDKSMAKFVVMAFDKGVPALLYVYTQQNNYFDYFFAKVKGKWVKSNFSEFVNMVETLKLGKQPREFTLNLNSTSSTDKFELDTTNNFKRYDTFTPRLGYFATSVYYNVSLLWTASMFGERCVSAWAFKYDDTHYLVRLLVVNAFGNFRFFNFVRVKERWVDAESDAFAFVQADDTKFPEDFYFPQYFLSSGNRKLFNSAPSVPVKKTELLKEAYDFKPESKREDYDFKYHNAAIPFKDCHKLDFSKWFLGRYTMTKKGVLDRVLPVKTVYPKSGNFFGHVADGKEVLYRRYLDSEACVGVHFYSKNNKYYLADVLVTSPHNPRSEYHVKEGGKWTSITKKAFLHLMDELMS